jgi:predicted amidohydrolase YtcJ
MPEHGTAELLLVATAVETFGEPGEPHGPDEPDGRGDAAPTAIAVAGGRVLAVGSEQSLAAFVGPATVLHRVEGVVLPGLTDAHIHPVWGALDLARGVGLTDVGPLAAVVAKVEAYAATLDPGEWVLGWGLDPNVFTDGVGGSALTAGVGGRPVALRMRDAHSVVANAAAIALAGISGSETFDDRSSVPVDADGRPTGHLLELGAMALVEAAIPAESPQKQADRVLDALDEMARRGLTGGHVMDFFDPAHEILTLVEQTHELPLRLRCSPMCPPDSPPAEWDRIAALQGAGGRRWLVEGVKFMIDGTVDGGTAWLDSPDAFGESTSSIWTSTDRYRDAIAYFVARDIPTATHAIGEAGVRFALETLRDAGAASSGVPHRIEHIESIPDDVLELFAEVGAVASMQPIHGTHHTRADRTDNWSVRVGAERAAHGWRCRDIRDRGITLALGSDWPVTPVDPRAMMADAQLRRPVASPEVDPVQPEQALTVRMAYEGYTTHAAAAAGHGDTQGRILPGYDADFTVFAAHPFELAPEKQAENRVVATFVGGALVRPTVPTA